MYCHPWRLVSPQNTLKRPIIAFNSLEVALQHLKLCFQCLVNAYRLVNTSLTCVVLLRVQPVICWRFHNHQNGQVWKASCVWYGWLQLMMTWFILVKVILDQSDNITLVWYELRNMKIKRAVSSIVRILTNSIWNPTYATYTMNELFP